MGVQGVWSLGVVLQVQAARLLGLMRVWRLSADQQRGGEGVQAGWQVSNVLKCHWQWWDSGQGMCEVVAAGASVTKAQSVIVSLAERCAAAVEAVSWQGRMSETEGREGE